MTPRTHASAGSWAQTVTSKDPHIRLRFDDDRLGPQPASAQREGGGDRATVLIPACGIMDSQAGLRDRLRGLRPRIVLQFLLRPVPIHFG
jgi:hypothetical protein